MWKNDDLTQYHLDLHGDTLPLDSEMLLAVWFAVLESKVLGNAPIGSLVILHVKSIV